MMHLERLVLRRTERLRDERKWRGAERGLRFLAWRWPRNAAIQVQLGHCLKEQGDIEGAFVHYRKAYELNPADADITHQLARAFELVGQYERAIAFYRAAARIDPLIPHILGEMERTLKNWNTQVRMSVPNLQSQLNFVVIGTTGVCNASCIHCPTGKANTSNVPRFPMPMPLFRTIVDGISDLNIEVSGQFSFGLFGDAFVDPYVLERAKYLRHRLPNAVISINTNGASFNRSKHAGLYDFDVTVALHCESLNHLTYNYLMYPLRLNRLIPKYHQIIESFPGKVKVSVPVSRANVDSLKDIESWFLNAGAKEVVFDPLSNRCSRDQTLFRSLAINPFSIRCQSKVLDDLIIDCDGRVLICCQDFERAEPIGLLEENGFEAVISDIARLRVRQDFDTEQHENYSTCKHCFADLRMPYSEIIAQYNSKNIEKFD